MRQPVLVRRFEPDDQVPVRDLILAGLAEHWGTDPEPTMNRDLDDIAAAYSAGTTLVALTGDDEIVGTGTIVPRGNGIAEIVRMSVASGLRGHGIGRQIVDALFEAATTMGGPIERVVLETTSSWLDTIGFYERCGFVVTHVADGEFGQDTWFERFVHAQP